jgi:ATP-dependent Lhr-like helicase
VVLVDGRLGAFIERGGRSLLTFPELDIDLAGVASAVADVARGRIKRMRIERIDGVPVADSALGKILAESGFIAGYKGVSLRGT